MKVNFKDPLSVSRGLMNDQVFISIKDSSMFVSNVTGEPILTKNTQILNDMPK